MTRRNEWRIWFVLVVLALIGWWLWGHYRHRDADVVTDGAAAPVAADAAVPDRPKPRAAAAAEDPMAVLQKKLMEHWWRAPIVSRDGAHALIVLLDKNDEPPTFRLFDLATGKRELELVVPALEAEAATPQARLDDLIRLRTLAAGFANGLDDRIAATPDGTRAVWQGGDELFTLQADNHVGPSLHKPAAYNPVITPDGTTVLMHGHDGLVDHEGKYAWFAHSLDPRKAGAPATKIPGTDGSTGFFRTTANAIRVVVSQEPTYPTCILEIPFAQPFEVTLRRCTGHSSRIVTQSPRGDWAAWHDGNTIHTLEIATGKLGPVVTRNGVFILSDEGIVIVRDDTGVFVSDPTSGATRRIPLPVPPNHCTFHGAAELLCVQDGELLAWHIPER